MREWFGARRLVLKTQYAAEQAGARVRELLRIGPATIPLEQVQRRLEMALGAMYGRAIPIAPIKQNVWTRERVRQFTRGDIRGAEATPSADAETIYLPAELATKGSVRQAIARYRLFAVEQAERITRGTATHAPTDDALERDLYLLREGAAIDAEIVRKHPGMREMLDRERKAVLARRPRVEQLTEAERDVERLVREALAAKPDAAAAPSASPEESRQWANFMAVRIRGRGTDYRGLPPASLWGTVREKEAGLEKGKDDKSLFGGKFDESPRESETGSSTDHVGKSAGAPREDGALPDPGAPGTMASAEDDPTLVGLPPAVYYDEWNVDRRDYVKRGAAVRLHEPELGDAAWAPDTLRSHGAVVRQIRQQFERLRARRTLLTRQRAGDELDLRACIDSMIDRRLGKSPDDRLYLDARPARRGLAIALLVDMSGSTEQQVTSEWRIVDLEKIALLLASQALDALGDLYAVYAFAGKTAQNVKVTVVKDFGERSGDTVNRRIAALTPGGFTRLGAAVRHATHQLARQSAGHRLLLLLSDGRPNDMDGYQGAYAVEDSRQAIFEARASGVYPFCLTIDRDASEYLPRIFGQAGHTILQRPQQLPTALLGVVRSLIKR